MRYSVGLPVDHVTMADEFVTGDAIAEMAAAVEAAGLDAVFVTDHPAPDERWLAGGGHHAQEPMVALAFAAAATRRVMLHTHVYVAAYRNPFLAAKGVATLQNLSGGRVLLGVAAGLPAAGVRRARRGVRRPQRPARRDRHGSCAGRGPRRAWRSRPTASPRGRHPAAASRARCRSGSVATAPPRCATRSSSATAGRRSRTRRPRRVR